MSTRHRKVIQIQSVAVQNEGYIIALCDDGTMWVLADADITTNDWIRVPDIPDVKSGPQGGVRT